jgi:hypothetical protein
LVPDGHLDLAVVCESRDSRAYYLNRVVVWVRQAEAGHDPQAVADLFPLHVLFASALRFNR